jgi:hypothetical protein
MQTSVNAFEGVGAAAQSNHEVFTAEVLNYLVNAYAAANDVEAEVVAKTAFLVASHKVARFIDKTLAIKSDDDLEFDAKVAYSMAGLRLFQNCNDTCAGLTVKDAQNFVAVGTAKKAKTVEMFRLRWKMGVTAANAAFRSSIKVNQIMVAFQSADIADRFTAFRDVIRADVDNAIHGVRAARKAKEDEKTPLDKILAYMGKSDLTSGMASEDWARVIEYAQTKYNEAGEAELARIDAEAAAAAAAAAVKLAAVKLAA